MKEILGQKRSKVRKLMASSGYEIDSRYAEACCTKPIERDELEPKKTRQKGKKKKERKKPGMANLGLSLAGAKLREFSGSCCHVTYRN